MNWYINYVLEDRLLNVLKEVLNLSNIDFFFKERYVNEVSGIYFLILINEELCLEMLRMYFFLKFG